MEKLSDILKVTWMGHGSRAEPSLFTTDMTFDLSRKKTKGTAYSMASRAFGQSLRAGDFSFSVGIKPDL